MSDDAEALVYLLFLALLIAIFVPWPEKGVFAYLKNLFKD